MTSSPRSVVKLLVCKGNASYGFDATPEKIVPLLLVLVAPVKLIVGRGYLTLLAIARSSSKTVVVTSGRAS
jgi:hypothetical protein